MKAKRNLIGAALTCGLLGLLAAGLAGCSQTNWKAAQGPLITQWAKDIHPGKVLPEYPRPQMVRKKWQNLNGLWDYAIAPKDSSLPEKWDGQILVPFCPESALSGVMKAVTPKDTLWYRRTIDVPNAWRKGGQRVLLHFGAVDWDATVFVNGKEVGAHKGGYDPFSFDATDALKDGAPQELVVKVWDPTDGGVQPIGKQRLKPEGIWYTAVSGIWQTVWMEPVPQTSIAALKIVPDLDASSVKVTVNVSGAAAGAKVKVAVADEAGGKSLAVGEGAAGEEIVIKVNGAKPWTPDTPVLYPMTVRLEGEKGDRVESYFGMRKIALGKDEKGLTRIMLNNKFLFQYGPLDQGWWPDGLYTAPTDEALKFDIVMTKKFGCNLARKHVKVEPARWYYWCDKLGLLVWQDMPSKFIGERSPRAADSAAVYEAEWPRIMEALHNNPCIVMWVPFNEGWGQYDTPRIVELTRKLDPTRLVNNASGWTDMGVGDVNDVHIYRGPGAPPAEEKRAIVLGEFGGLGLAIPDHIWKAEGGNWGYEGLIKDRQALTETYVGLLHRLHRLVGEPGLSAAVYTQTTDCEIEVNGMMTYDRAVIKMDVEQIAAAAKALYGPPPQVKAVVPDARTKAQEWAYTTDKPAAGWEKADFNDGQWSKGPSGFGTKTTPGAVVGTEWSTGDIWLRRTFEWPAGSKAANALLTLHHDEDAEVYINGVLAVKVGGYTQGYEEHGLSAKAQAALKEGKNVIAIHCKQTGGGQYIDAGLVELMTGK